MAQLTAWASFYVITGSSAGALIGLTFVVISLTSSARRGSTAAVNAYSTPTVVHFCQVLFISVLLSAPWSALWPISLLLVLAGLGGTGYAVLVLRRIVTVKGTHDYEPVIEDWLTHVVLPLVAYIAILVAALLLVGGTVPALFAIAAAMLLLLFDGIHNTWDAATFLTVTLNRREDSSQQ